MTMQNGKQVPPKGRKEISQDAYSIAASMVESYLEAGQPFDEYFDNGWPEETAKAVAEKLQEIADSLRRHAGGRT